MGIASCTASRPLDPTDNEKIVLSAKALQYGFPFYYIHPGAWRPQNNDLVESTRGTVAWTPSPRVGNNYQLDDKETYIRRLENASIPLQSSYNEYQQKDDAGFPGMYTYVNNVYYEEPEAKYQAGYVCYAYVARAMKDAGITLIQGDPYGIGYLLVQCIEIIDINPTNVKPGDFVVYDYGSGSYSDHIAIITEVIGTDPENWGIISCNGLVEVFEWGVNETKLGAFQNTTDGGLFDWWSYPLNYRVYTNRK